MATIEHINHLPTPIAIVGMGLSGESALNMLLEGGITRENIVTFDQQDKKAQYSDPEKMLRECSPHTLIVSPGVPLQQSWICRFQGLVTSEMDIAFQYLKNKGLSEKIIGVTGSLGKSTVVSLLGAGACAEDANAFVGGNIGVPFADYARRIMQGKPRATWVVLELSSYQLDNIGRFECDYSLITYLAPNHLERYSSLQEYYQSKWSLVTKTKKKAVLNAQGGDLKAWVTNQAFDPKKCFFVDHDSDLIKRHSLNKSKLIGQHNQDNIACAAAIAEMCGWSEKAFGAMIDFAGLPHRMQNLGICKQGVHYVNDSKATTMESVLTASAGVRSQTANTIYLLLGGKDKNLPWEKLSVLQADKGLVPIFFGACGSLAKSKSGLAGQVFSKLKEGILFAQNKAKPGDFIVLSPGGTSLDEFKNFEERGHYFAKLMKAIEG